MENEEVGSRSEDLTDAIAAARTVRPVGSPCIDVCRMDQTRSYCEGCLRTREEIKAWKSLSESEKLTMLDRLSERNSERV
ncbi:DUF1289 domain-containing protein [Trinickia sp. NRRL B-1857]|uniref:DUF1289 domain-containing protein n=1 Tax=Trinickia sp. NRRL B-1857 TaxID=3162879 RepID=UPI003D299AA3